MGNVGSFATRHPAPKSPNLKPETLNPFKCSLDHTKATPWMGPAQRPHLHSTAQMSLPSAPARVMGIFSVSPPWFWSIQFFVGSFRTPEFVERAADLLHRSFDAFRLLPKHLSVFCDFADEQALSRTSKTLKPLLKQELDCASGSPGCSLLGAGGGGGGLRPWELGRYKVQLSFWGLGFRV